jgi:DNA modification methylase
VAGQLGLERTPDEYVARLTGVFAEVRRVLRDDGTLWLNLGDSYANDGKWGGSSGGKHVTALHGQHAAGGLGRGKRKTGLKPKDLVGIPWRVAFALQADGWYLRCDIVWDKPTAMPESVTDRPTRSHEYVFLLSKSLRYHYDASAVAEPVAATQLGRVRADVVGGASHVERGQHSKGGTYRGSSFNRGKTGVNGNGRNQPDERRRDPIGLSDLKNARSVWRIATKPFSEAHFATMPVELAQRCIRAGSKAGDCVLDPFAGAGTTLLAATGLARRAIGIELNPEYAAMAVRRCDEPLFTGIGA